MARRSEHTREQLAELILDAAQALIAANGLAGLSARGIAKRIGYTPGTLYLVFANLDDVILHVNARTLDRLHMPMQTAIAAEPAPMKQLVQAARAYAYFARENPNLWRACFEHRLPEDIAGPAFLDARIAKLVGLIMQPLAAATGAQDAALDRAAQALWSGVHGICILTLTGKLQMVGHSVGGQQTEQLTDELVTHYINGLIMRDRLSAPNS